MRERMQQVSSVGVAVFVGCVTAGLAGTALSDAPGPPWSGFSQASI